eukprot:Platyproteum_vivax@DN8909_c0_g1_i1.p1
MFCKSAAELNSKIWFSNIQIRNASLVSPHNLIRHWKIKIHDRVEVISGKDKGKQGKILACDIRRNCVRVEGCNLRKMVDLKDKTKVSMIPKKIHVSNVNLVDPVTRRPTRIFVRYTQEGKMLRVSKQSGAIIPYRDTHIMMKDYSKTVPGLKDTPPEVALEKTYEYNADSETLRLLRQTMSKYNHDRH